MWQVPSSFRLKEDIDPPRIASLICKNTSVIDIRPLAHLVIRQLLYCYRIEMVNHSLQKQKNSAQWALFDYLLYLS